MLKLDILSKDLKKRRSRLRKSADGIITEIYSFLSGPSEKTRAAIEEWERIFRFLYGGAPFSHTGNIRFRTDGLLAEYSAVPGSDGEKEAVRLLIFSIQTYYSLLVKYIINDILGCINNDGTAGFSYKDIILGTFASMYGIDNYITPDPFCWPVYELENGFDRIMDRISADLSPYRPENTRYGRELKGYDACDYIRQIYEALLPKELRHALGEYYTPDWLAEMTFETTLGFSGGKDIKTLSVIDPTCGSGTFLIQAIEKKKRAGCDIEDITSTVSGIDINPLAVLTAKTNYLIMLAGMTGGKTNISIPVYRADILTVFTDRSTDNLYPDAAAVRALGKADVIIGNPPWINREYLPDEYRKSTEHLWEEHGLFTAKGLGRSFSKEDISLLITCEVTDRLLDDGGIIGFVIKQSVFKSAKNGAAFRRFQVRGAPLRVLRADDLSALNIFGGAVNRTALLFARKGQPTVYPVPYFLWRGKEGTGRRTFGTYSRLGDVLGKVGITKQSAFPSVREDITSPWSTAEPEHTDSYRNVLGSNSYRARTGVFTGGANAVYYLDINSCDGELVSVTNITDRAKRSAGQYAAALEKDYIYPLLRGRDVSRWKASYDTYILCPHTADTRMLPVSQDRLRTSAPLTMSYLEHFRPELDGRKGFAGWERKIQEREFHAILRVGEYTFSPYKVVWRYIADDFICAVTGCADDVYLGRKIILPNEKLMFISAGSEDEAYYLCGLLSSTPVSRCVRSFMSGTSISAHVLDKLYIPAFDPSDKRHTDISKLCRDGHDNGDIEGHIGAIDVIAREIYGITGI